MAENERISPSTSDYIYPKYLNGARSNFVRFTAHKYVFGGSGGDKIASLDFYHPGNIAFADGASYTTFDMGAIGRMAADTINRGGDVTDNLLAETRNVVSNSESLSGYIGYNILKNAILGTSGTDDRLSNVYTNVKGIAINPNTTVSFTNMNIRTYLFNFKLIAESPNDTYLIRDIQNFIRTYMYAEQAAEGILLNYPSTWKITFHTEDGGENPYYPNIYECFLTNMQTNFNASSHLHHEGGAPVEVDLSLTFQETKVLTRNDILAMASEMTGG